MNEEDAVAEPPSCREDVATAGSGSPEEEKGAPDESAHDVDSKPPRPAKEPDQEEDVASADVPRAGSAGVYRAPGSSASTRKREKKKKGRGGGLDGEPAMSVEDLFVTISTVQVCTLCCTDRIVGASTPCFRLMLPHRLQGVAASNATCVW